MPDIDPAAYLGQPGGSKPLLTAPAPIYQPINLGGESQGMAMAMSMYMPQILSMFGFGSNTFLPQQFPAQQLLDQMTSAKYLQDSAVNRAQFVAPDREAVFQRFSNMRQSMGMEPLVPGSTGEASLRKFAGMASGQFGQQIAGMIFGPQNAEDIFFGRRGSGAQLASAVNQFGFYRPDAVNGADRMSADSLKQFTAQLYSNLYGPGADLNDVSGISAGRMGTVSNELARRGLLPASLGVMSESVRKQALRDPTFRPRDFEETIARDIADQELRASGEDFGGKRYDQLDERSRQEIVRNRTADPNSAFRRQAAETISKLGDDKTTTEEISKLAGGDSAIRRIDATRVGNKLKEYSGAVDAVRAIFGDNGMGSAPFSQLIASLDSLTQGGMATMGAGKIENLMRRTQMAARDSGVSLEALMGLTARGGALADQNGLVRDVVPEQVIATMQRTRAMRDSGAFTPGFGRMDPNTAALFVMDQQSRADSSMSARLAATARRIVKENEGNAAFQGDEKTADLRNFVAAMERGDTTFVNTAGDTVNITEQMGKNPGKFFSGMFDPAGITEEEVSARLYDDTNTQEYLLPGYTARAQRYEATQSLGGAFFQDFLRKNQGENLTNKDGGTMSREDRETLAETLGQSFSTAMIDEVNNSMKPEERIATLQNAARRGVERFVRQQNPGLGEKEIKDETERLLVSEGGLFQNPEEFRKFVGNQQAYLGRYFEGTTGINIERFRQTGNISVLSMEIERDRKNRARAEMFETLGGSVSGDGSNFLQRLSDYFLDGAASGKGFGEYVLGTIDTEEKQKQLIEATGGRGVFDAAMEVAGKELSEARIDSDPEKDEAVKDLFRPGTAAEREQAFSNMKKRFEALGMSTAAGEFAGKKTAISTNELVENIKRRMDDPNDTGQVTASLRAQYKAKMRDGKKVVTEEDVDKAFSADNRDKTIRELVGSQGFEDYTRATVDAAALESIGLGADVSTERQVRASLDTYGIAAGSFHGDQDVATKNQKRIDRVGKLISEMNQGTISSDTIMQITETGRHDMVNETAVKKSIDAAIAGYNDTTLEKTSDGKERRQSKTMDDLRDTLAVSGISAEEQQQIIDMTQFARAQRIVGGFSELGTPGSKENIERSSRVAALKTALDAGTIDKNSKLGQALATIDNKDATPEQKKEAEKTITDATTGTQQDFHRAVTDATPTTLPDGKDKSAEVKRVVDDATRIEKAATASEMDRAGTGGPFDGIFGQIGDTLSKALADGFKDVKIENVTITNLHLPNLLGGLFNGLTGAGTTEKDTDAKKSGKHPTVGDTAKDAEKAEKKPNTTPTVVDPASSQQAQVDDKKDQGTMTERVLAFMQNIPELLMQNMGGMGGGTGGAGPTELSGTITINGLQRAFAELQVRHAENTTGNGAPVMPQTPAST